MNLSEFLRKTDAAAAQMSRDELMGFVHELARTLRQEEREDFLQRISTSRQVHAGNAIASQTKNSRRDEELLEDCREVLEQLERIANGELCLTGSLNEEYDDWYDNGEEFFYADPNGVGAVISRACELARLCIECGQYQTVCDMAELLVGLEITVAGEYQEYSDEPLSIGELEYRKLADFDYKQFLVDALYAVYQTEKPEDRPEALFDLIENSRRNDITLEMVLQDGSELPDLPSFLPLWISCLGAQTSRNAGRLLKEAVALSADPDELLKNARRFRVQHPGLYKQYLAENEAKEAPERLLEVGDEALGAIEDKYRIRSGIALILSRIALKADKQEKAESCWLEAFRSDTTVENYLRLFMECRDFSRYETETEQICRNAYACVEAKGLRFTANGESEENQPVRNQIYMLAVLRGKLLFVRDSAMNCKENLGWSSTFMKCGLAAFLLFLLETEDLQPGGRAMVNQILSGTGFKKEHVQDGLLRTIPEDSGEWFWKCICRCKKAVHLSPEEKDDHFAFVQNLVKRRVIGIMEANKCNYYEECAAYIAALGEVTESRGEKDGKQRVMREFMSLYPRRYAFRAKLCGFGMADTGKKR